MGVKGHDFRNSNPFDVLFQNQIRTQTDDMVNAGVSITFRGFHDEASKWTQSTSEID